MEEEEPHNLDARLAKQLNRDMCFFWILLTPHEDRSDCSGFLLYRFNDQLGGEGSQANEYTRTLLFLRRYRSATQVEIRMDKGEDDP